LSCADMTEIAALAQSETCEKPRRCAGAFAIQVRYF
jgi:hypothetical protein